MIKTINQGENMSKMLLISLFMAFLSNQVLASNEWDDEINTCPTYRGSEQKECDFFKTYEVRCDIITSKHQVSKKEIIKFADLSSNRVKLCIDKQIYSSFDFRDIYEHKNIQTYINLSKTHVSSFDRRTYMDAGIKLFFYKKNIPTSSMEIDRLLENENFKLTIDLFDTSFTKYRLVEFKEKGAKITGVLKTTNRWSKYDIKDLLTKGFEITILAHATSFSKYDLKDLKESGATVVVKSHLRSFSKYDLIDMLEEGIIVLVYLSQTNYSERDIQDLKEAGAIIRI